jgi:hypothetical protein
MMEISPAILTFFGAILGAMIGATVSPFVQWQIEKKRQRLAYKRELISRWRKMFEKYTDTDTWKLPDKDLLYSLTKESDYLSFITYSTVKGSHQLPASEKEFLANSYLHHSIYLYLQEIVRLEKEWKLL